MEITFLRALKIWWSFMWRAWVLTMPTMLVVAPLMIWVMPFTRSGTMPMNPAEMSGFFGKFFIVWIIMMVMCLSVQILALKWALKTQWSDFRLLAVKTEAPPLSVVDSTPL